MGFAQNGVAIQDGANLAIAGQRPSGLAAQGQVIWRPWQILNGLVDFWPMNEGSGATFNNVINPANPMTAQNITWASSFTGLGLSPQFNGSTSGAVSTQPNTLNGPFSICIALNGLVTSTGLQPVLIRSFTTGVSTVGFQVTVIGRNLANYIVSGTSPTWAGINVLTGPSANLTDNQSAYIVVTYDGSGVAAGIRSYINGISVSQTVTYDTLAGSFASNFPVYIGQDEAGGSRWNGTLANARIYNRVLSASEVAALSATFGR